MTPMPEKEQKICPVCLTNRVEKYPPRKDGTTSYRKTCGVCRNKKRSQSFPQPVFAGNLNQKWKTP